MTAKAFLKEERKEKKNLKNLYQLKVAVASFSSVIIHLVYFLIYSLSDGYPLKCYIRSWRNRNKPKGQSVTS